MLRAIIPLAAAAVLAAPAGALAADPVPGATYEGTTDSGSPFSLKVAPDGASVTDITTSAPLTCVGPEGGVEIFALVSKTPIPVAGGAFAGKDDEAMPRLEVQGTFASAGEATGTLIARTSKFKYDEGLTTCMKELTFTARTSAAPGQGGVTAGAPGVTLGGASTGKLGRVLRKGLTVSGTTTAGGRVAAVARLSARDARRYRVGRVLARRSGNVPGGPFALTLKPSKAAARKLGRARRLKVSVVVTPDGGAPTRTTVTLKR